ncbi:hypothetical protein [Streptomyces sp. NPDC051286]|uniref:hypothetical protein n=1 Tax=Streptomyces sp. NPDC051286 TaxID=3365647 RepID=UPI003799CE99
MTTAEPDSPSTADSAASSTADSAADARDGALPVGREGRGTPAGNAPAGAGRLLRDPVTIAVVTAGLLHLLWFRFVANSGGDIASQDAWAGFVGRHPGSAYDFDWYGGIYPMSYSVVSSYVMAAFGVRTTTVIAGGRRGRQAREGACVARRLPGRGGRLDPADGSGTRCLPDRRAVRPVTRNSVFEMNTEQLIRDIARCHSWPRGNVMFS